MADVEASAALMADATPADVGSTSGRIPGKCSDTEEGVVTPGSVDAFDALLVGRWLYCSSMAYSGGTTNLTHSPDEAGIEFASDGNWYTLTVGAGGAGGTLVRSTAGSLTEQGTWSTVVNGMTPSGAPVIGLSIAFANAGLGWQLTFSARPTKFSGSSDAGEVTYVAVP
jgi:hypothetical protein